MSAQHSSTSVELGLLDLLTTSSIIFQSTCRTDVFTGGACGAGGRNTQQPSATFEDFNLLSFQIQIWGHLIKYLPRRDYCQTPSPDNHFSTVAVPWESPPEYARFGFCSVTVTDKSSGLFWVLRLHRFGLVSVFFVFFCFLCIQVPARFGSLKNKASDAIPITKDSQTHTASHTCR